MKNYYTVKTNKNYSDEIVLVTTRKAEALKEVSRQNKLAELVHRYYKERRYSAWMEVERR